MSAQISYFDMSVITTPPTGHGEPFPLLLGPNQQPNDLRLLFASGSGTSGDITLMIPMSPDPPTGFTAAYNVNPTPGQETRGVYYRLLQLADADTSVSFPKPSGWRDFVWVPITARGVNPTVAPIAGALGLSHTGGASTLTVASVTVPAAGEMIFCIWIVADPEGRPPSWPVSAGTPTGWGAMEATDKSGPTYYQYATDPSVVVFGKSFASAGSTGSVSVPVGLSSMAFAGMYAFLQPAPDVSVAIGAA